MKAETRLWWSFASIQLFFMGLDQILGIPSRQAFIVAQIAFVAGWVQAELYRLDKAREMGTGTEPKGDG